MNTQRRSLLAAAGSLPAALLLNGWADNVAAAGERHVLSSFAGGENFVIPGGGWRGFSDRVMGGISNATLSNSTIEGRNCLRLTGNVTRESNGGFIQMALYFGNRNAEFDGSAYKGIELLTYGNNEEYNVHVRTADCGWHNDSYRMSFFAKPEWQRLQIPWSAFTANNVKEPLDSSRLQRIAILGWMREFEADISLAEIALYS